jgi:hypothetical protein
MSKAKLIYQLNKEGQQKSLENGGNGEKMQVLEVETTPEIMEFADIMPDGSIIANLSKGMFEPELYKTFEFVKMPDNKPDLAVKKWDIRKTPRHLIFSVPQAVESLLVWREIHLQNQRKQLEDLYLIQKMKNKDFDTQLAQTKKVAAEAWAKEEQGHQEKMRKLQEELTKQFLPTTFRIKMEIG